MTVSNQRPTKLLPGHSQGYGTMENLDKPTHVSIAFCTGSLVCHANALKSTRVGPWSSFRPPRRNQRPNSNIQQVRDAEPFRRTQPMNWVRLSGDDGQGHDGATTG